MLPLSPAYFPVNVLFNRTSLLISSSSTTTSLHSAFSKTELHWLLTTQQQCRIAGFENMTAMHVSTRKAALIDICTGGMAQAQHNSRNLAFHNFAATILFVSWSQKHCSTKLVKCLLHLSLFMYCQQHQLLLLGHLTSILVPQHTISEIPSPFLAWFFKRVIFIHTIYQWTVTLCTVHQISIF